MAKCNQLTPLPFKRLKLCPIIQFTDGQTNGHTLPKVEVITVWLRNCAKLYGTIHVLTSFNFEKSSYIVSHIFNFVATGLITSAALVSSVCRDTEISKHRTYTVYHTQFQK